MFGLIVLGVIAIYIAFCIFVIKSVTRWARNTGRGVRRWGVIAALAVYLPVFWDHIPTVLLHRYVCATEQGFWVYKTLEQWQKENPGVAEKLSSSDSLISSNAQGITRGYVLNQRFSWEVIERQPVPVLPVVISDHRVVDRANKEVMAKHVSVGVGYGSLAYGHEGSWKFWLDMPACNDTREQFVSYRKKMESQGDKK